MNKLNLLLTMFLCLISINKAHGMNVDEVEKRIILKRATFNNSTEGELWVRLFKTKPMQLCSLRGLLKINESRTIETSDLADRDFSIVLSYTQNYGGAVMVRLDTLHKNYDVDDEGAGLIIREILQEI